MKKYNFNAGPSMLPREVIEATAAACLDFEGCGLSLMEISHRAKNFQPVVDKAEALVKELLDIPAGYSVVFLAGGASTEFCRVPYNFLEKKAAYLNTGTWAKKAMKEAKAFGETIEVASSEKDGYTYIPKNYEVPADADYAQAVAWAVKENITTGTGASTFSPDSVCTRGEIVTFLHRAFSD